MNRIINQPAINISSGVGNSIRSSRKELEKVSSWDSGGWTETENTVPISMEPLNANYCGWNGVSKAVFRFTIGALLPVKSVVQLTEKNVH